LKEFGIHDSHKGIFIIVICSKWCSSCRLFAPILENLRDNGFIKFIEMAIDENINLVREFNINAVPALLFFKNGKFLNKNIKINGEIFVNNGVMVGSFNETIIKEVIQQISI